MRFKAIHFPQNDDPGAKLNEIALTSECAMRVTQLRQLIKIIHLSTADGMSVCGDLSDRKSKTVDEVCH